ncbi:hypothetical protein LVD17_08930 [Fulvivirga ulvae]|nr:hypothetical protein [Fulvivirga ulvae]UII33937.1 hypothetical protein LVD17_08930 [Fulvivirga ulvae]
MKNMNLINEYPDCRKLFKGTMLDGTELAIWKDVEGNIISTYPVINQ